MVAEVIATEKSQEDGDKKAPKKSKGSQPMKNEKVKDSEQERRKDKEKKDNGKKDKKQKVAKGKKDKKGKWPRLGVLSQKKCCLFPVTSGWGIVYIYILIFIINN